MPKNVTKAARFDLMCSGQELKTVFNESDITRRRFNAGVAGLTVLSGAITQVAEAEQTDIASVHTVLVINGQRHELSLDPRVTLLDLLRERLALPGTKKGCDHGQCGACTVLVNGHRVNSCLTLTAAHDGDEITTIEGLASGSDLHPLQEAFIERDAFQCGYCTPGQICSGVAAIAEARAGVPSAVTRDLKSKGPIELSDEEIRERMSGNICRCGAYPNIVAAVRFVSQSGKQS
jgi:xanthine dehydrogenase YagT iron-sulfur-binding subunit